MNESHCSSVVAFVMDAADVSKETIANWVRASLAPPAGAVKLSRRSSRESVDPADVHEMEQAQKEFAMPTAENVSANKGDDHDKVMDDMFSFMP